MEPNTALPPRPRPRLALWGALVALSGTLGCNTSETPKGGQNQPGTVVQDPDSGRWFIVDDNDGGLSPQVRVVRAAWGRLVDVFGLDGENGNERVLMQERFVINPELQSDTTFELETNPVTSQQTLTILRDVSDTAPGGGREQFFLKLIQAEAGLQPIFDNGLSGAGFFSMVPRNATAVIHLDDLLDPSSLDQTTVRVLTGTAPAEQDKNIFESRLMLDPNHGDLGNFGGKHFFSTRVLIDMTVSELESFEVDPPLPVNAVGLPPSINVNLSNLQVRIPTRTDPVLGQDHLLQNPSGHPLATTSNGTVDFSDPTLDVVRAMRSGGPEDVTNDPFNGFLRDQDAPRVVGLQESAIIAAPSSDNPPPLGDGTLFTLPTFQFRSEFCAQTPSVGDIISQPGLFAEVVQQPAPQQSGVVTNLKVRLIVWPSAWNAQGGPLVWETTGVGPAQFFSPYHPVSDAGREACFVRVIPNPTGWPEDPTTGVFTSSNFEVRFSEPMDPGAMTAFDSFTLTRQQVPTASYHYVVGHILQSIDLQGFTFVPDLPLAHELGQQEPYWMTLVNGDQGPSDLAGNDLAASLPAVLSTVETSAAPQRNGGRVSRFSSVDEEPPIAGPEDPPLPEWGGQIVFDLSRELIRARPVTRFQTVVDRANDMVAAMNANPTGVQSPLSNFGSKTQIMWRFVDMGFPLLDGTLYNIDVEGLNWAPLGGLTVVDKFELFEIRLNHHGRFPDEVVGGIPPVPFYPNSGVLNIFDNNFLTSINDPQKIVHPRFLKYSVNPGDVFTTASGLKLLPFPLNRTVSPNQFQYYTWRDTSIQERGGPDNFGVYPLQWHVVTGTPIPITGDCTGMMAPPTPNPFYGTGQIQTVAMPLLMEFRCFPDDGALGINRFDTSVATTVSTRPYFRAFSTGGIDTNFNRVLRDPDLEERANGGFDPTSLPTPGAPTFGQDNEVYIGAVDFVTRVSRSFSIFFPAIDPTTGGTQTFPNPNYFPATVEPPFESQPLGSSLEIAYRGATIVTNTEALSNATELDLYGDHYLETPSPCDGSITHNITPPGEFNTNIAFLNGDMRWFTNVMQINGSSYYQVRLTFTANTQTGLGPEVSAFGLTWSE